MQAQLRQELSWLREQKQEHCQQMPEQQSRSTCPAA
jgi:hypothetical protein